MCHMSSQLLARSLAACMDDREALTRCADLQVKDRHVWGRARSYSLKLFMTDDILGDWVEHPMSPISGDLRYARGGGRPFIMNGTVYRWAQDDSDFFGASLHLFKINVLKRDQYYESYVKSLEPSGNGNWYSARTHHIDIQQVRCNDN